MVNYNGKNSISCDKINARVNCKTDALPRLMSLRGITMAYGKLEKKFASSETGKMN